MKKKLKCLDETIAELEHEIQNHSCPFLISTVERLRFYRDNDIQKLIDQVKVKNL